MAASKLKTPEEILDEIGEDCLSCPVCLEQYKNPKILPCQHSFCQPCLEKLVEKTGQLLCPTCQASVQLPGGRVSRLTNSFFMNSLLQVVENRKEVASMQQSSKCESCGELEAAVFCEDCHQYYCDVCLEEIHKKLKHAAAHEILMVEENKKGKGKRATLKPTQNCEVHPKNEVKYYCDTCQIPICSECTIIEHRIPDHTHRYLQGVADEYSKKLVLKIEKLKVKAQEVERNTAVARNACKSVTERCEAEKEKVTNQKDALNDKIEKEERHLVEKLNVNYSLEVKGLQAEIDDLQLKYEKLVNTCGYVETLMHHGTAAQLVSNSQSMMSQIEELVGMDTKADMKSEVVEFLPASDFTEDGILGLVKSDVCISECTVDNIPKSLLKGESVDVVITTKDKSGKTVIPRQEVKVTVTNPNGFQKDLDVIDNRNGTHTVTILAQTDGKYQVTMVIGDQNIPGSPFTVDAIKGLVKTLGQLGCGKGEFQHPHSLAINKNGDLVVADCNNNRIEVIDMDGKWKKSLTFTKFEKRFKPGDVAVSADNRYFMADLNNKQVVVSDEDGNVIKCFGQTELKYIGGICISPLNGAVYVSDWETSLGKETKETAVHCVRKYTQDGQYLKSFGHYGNNSGEFDGPSGMVIDSQGMLFVADSGNCRVQVFNADDQFLYKFKIPSKRGAGYLVCPFGLCFDPDRYVYVTDSCCCIQKFDFSGRLISCISREEDRLAHPQGMVVTDSVPVKMFVADSGNHCIRVYVL